MNLDIFALLVFFSVAALILGVRGYLDRDPVKERIVRSQKRVFLFGEGARKALMKLWHIEDDSIISFERAVLTGGVSSLAFLLILFAMARPVAVSSIVLALAIAAGVFCGVPVLHTLFLREILVREFQKEAEFIAESVVAVLSSTGGDLKRAVAETAGVNLGNHVKRELMRVSEDIASQKTVAKSLMSLAKRIPCRETQDIADAAELFETVGGASALTLFKNVRDVFKENSYNRARARRAFKTIKLQAGIIGALPVVCTLFLMTRHSWAELLLTTGQGKNALALAALIYIVAAFLMYFIFKSVDLK